MSACRKCGADETLFGHQGLCAKHYAAYMDHQKELRDISVANREMLAARIVHPAGKSRRQRASDLWIDTSRHERSGAAEVAEEMR